MSWALSSSTNETTVTDNSQSTSQAATIGDLSSNNEIVYGDYVEQGLVGGNLSTVLDAITSATDKTVSTMDSLFGRAVGAVQSNSAKAIEATGAAYAESKSELRNFVDAVRPIALYAAIAAALYFVFGSKGRRR